MPLFSFFVKCFHVSSSGEKLKLLGTSTVSPLCYRADYLQIGKCWITLGFAWEGNSTILLFICPCAVCVFCDVNRHKLTLDHCMQNSFQFLYNPFNHSGFSTHNTGKLIYCNSRFFQHCNILGIFIGKSKHVICCFHLHLLVSIKVCLIALSGAHTTEPLKRTTFINKP